MVHVSKMAALGSQPIQNARHRLNAFPDGRELAESRGFLLGDAEQLLMNLTWATTSPLPALRTLPFRIMLIASMPCKVRHAVRTDPLPFASQVRHFTLR
jgi:hypothetical protein